MANSSNSSHYLSSVNCTSNGIGPVLHGKATRTFSVPIVNFTTLNRSNISSLGNSTQNSPDSVVSGQGGTWSPQITLQVVGVLLAGCGLVLEVKYKKVTRAVIWFCRWCRGIHEGDDDDEEIQRGAVTHEERQLQLFIRGVRYIAETRELAELVTNEQNAWGEAQELRNLENRPMDAIPVANGPYYYPISMVAYED